MQLLVGMIGTKIGHNASCLSDLEGLPPFIHERWPLGFLSSLKGNGSVTKTFSLAELEALTGSRSRWNGPSCNTVLLLDPVAPPNNYLQPAKGVVPRYFVV